MSDQDVFEQAGNQDQGGQGGNENTENSQETSNVDVFADKLSSITNEDGTPKYTDVASALDSIPHAQQHISTIESENAELKKKLAEEQAAKELLAKQAQKLPESQPGLTAEDVARIAAETQQKANEANQKQANRDAVNAKFSEHFGDKAVQEMQRVAKESGMTVGAIAALAESSPQAVFKLAGINTPSQQGTPPKSPGAGSGDHFTEQRKPEEPKSVMSGASTHDMVNAWKQAGAIVEARNQQ